MERISSLASCASSVFSPAAVGEDKIYEMNFMNVSVIFLSKRVLTNKSVVLSHEYQNIMRMLGD